MTTSLVLPVTTMFNDKGLKQAHKAFGQFGGAIKGVLGAAGLTLGLSAFVNGIQDATKAAVEDQKSQALLARQLKNTVRASDEVTASVEAQITKMSLASSVADDKIRPAYAMLIRSTGKVKDATRLTNLALDISAATGKDVETVAKALGRAYNGSAGALGKLGIKVKDTKHPFDELEKAFAGSAETAAKNDPYQRLNVIFGEISETIGRAFIPFLNDVADWFTNNFDNIQKFFTDALDSKPFKDLQEIGGRLWNEVLVPLGEWFMSKPVQDGLDAVWTGMTNLVNAALDFAQSGLGKFLLGLTDTVLITGLNALGSALKGIADAIERLSGKAIYQGIDKAYTAYGTITQGNTQGTTFVGGGGQWGAATYGIGGMSSLSVPKAPSYGGTGGIPRETNIYYNTTVNGVVGDKAAVGKTVVESIKTYEKQSGSKWRQ